MLLAKNSITSLLLLLLVSCTQAPSKIVYKGHIFYGHNNMQTNKTKTITKSIKTTSNKKTVSVKSSKKAVKQTIKGNKITIKEGDSLYAIAKRYKVNVRDLISSNNLKPPYPLQTGNKLIIPNKRLTYIVRKGDNISKIARLHNVSKTEIITVNDLSRPYKIKPGNILILPYSEKPTNKTTKHQKIAIEDNLESKINFIWPIKGRIISKFGPKANGLHNDGLNIKADFGSPIKAAADGKVVYVGNELRGYGNLIIIKHLHGWLTAYAHNDEIYVEKNQEVKQGNIIATVGDSGNVDISQLHFGLRKGRKAIDPEKYFTK